MISLNFVFIVLGLVMAGVAIVNARDSNNPRRWNSAIFWGCYAVTFLFGGILPDFVNGLLVLVMVAVAGIGRLSAAPGDRATLADRMESARKFGNRLFIPALMIPAVAVLGSFVFKSLPIGGMAMVDPKNATVVWLAIGVVLALIAGFVLVRPSIETPIVEARRLLDSVGWAAVLPQILAALGAVFAAAGVGQIFATLADRFLPLGTPFAAVLAYAVGMALLTMLMGNAFAAFPVMTAGIALPLIVHQFGGSVTVVAAIGMLSGFCGTLMTPLAANFNIVPARLLELPSDNAVIRVQIPTALILLAANIAIMMLFAFH